MKRTETNWIANLVMLSSILPWRFLEYWINCCTCCDSLCWKLRWHFTLKKEFIVPPKCDVLKVKFPFHVCKQNFQRIFFNNWTELFIGLHFLQKTLALFMTGIWLVKMKKKISGLQACFASPTVRKLKARFKFFQFAMVKDSTFLKPYRDHAQDRTINQSQLFPSLPLPSLPSLPAPVWHNSLTLLYLPEHIHHYHEKWMAQGTHHYYSPHFPAPVFKHKESSGPTPSLDIGSNGWRMGTYLMIVVGKGL